MAALPFPMFRVLLSPLPLLRLSFRWMPLLLRPWLFLPLVEAPTLPPLQQPFLEDVAGERGGAATSQVWRMALLSMRLTNSNPKYLAPSTSASSSGLEADSITCGAATHFLWAC